MKKGKNCSCPNCLRPITHWQFWLIFYMMFVVGMAVTRLEKSAGIFFLACVVAGVFIDLLAGALAKRDAKLVVNVKMGIEILKVAAMILGTGRNPSEKTANEEVEENVQEV